MLNIPNSIKNLLNSDRCRKNFRARFPGGELPDITNKDVVQESVRFTESICSQDVLKFGLTEASVIEFETVGVANMYGLMVEAYCEIDVSGLSAAELDDIRAGSWDGELVERAASDIGWPFFRIPYGVFRVESCPRNQEAMAHRKVTAYSLSYARMSKALVSLPTELPFSSIAVDPMAFYAQATEDGLMETSPSSDTAVIVEETLFDLSKTEYSFVAIDGNGKTISYDSWKFNTGTNNIADFVRLNLAWDKAAYAALGESVAAWLDAQGLDLSYDTNGVKIYKGNLEALRDKAPVFFQPVITTTASKLLNDGYYQYYTPILFQPIESDKMMPIMREYISSTTAVSRPDMRPAWAPGSSKPFANLKSSLEYLPAGTVALRMYAEKGSTSSYQDIPLPLVPEVNIFEVRSYKISDPSKRKLQFASTGAAAIPWTMETPTSASAWKLETLPRYSYVDAYDREALLDGYLELNAMFGKVNRAGKLQGLRLSTDEPVAVKPSQYLNFWWDEYDVAPIGSVLYSFEDEEEGAQTLEYNFGAGASMYDMTDNALLKALETPTAEVVQGMLDQNFIPHLLPVAFTPIELSMQGQPYLEDGDYLAVTAADGTVARSFNMRHELSGIQVLEAEVTSVSGQIMDSDVEVYG